MTKRKGESLEHVMDRFLTPKQKKKIAKRKELAKRYAHIQKKKLRWLDTAPPPHSMKERRNEDLVTKTC